MYREGNFCYKDKLGAYQCTKDLSPTFDCKNTEDIKGTCGQAWTGDCADKESGCLSYNTDANIFRNREVPYCICDGLDKGWINHDNGSTWKVTVRESRRCSFPPLVT